MTIDERVERLEQAVRTLEDCVQNLIARMAALEEPDRADVLEEGHRAFVARLRERERRSA